MNITSRWCPGTMPASVPVSDQPKAVWMATGSPGCPIRASRWSTASSTLAPRSSSTSPPARSGISNLSRCLRPHSCRRFKSGARTFTFTTENASGAHIVFVASSVFPRGESISWTRRDSFFKKSDGQGLQIKNNNVFNQNLIYSDAPQGADRGQSYCSARV